MTTRRAFLGAAAALRNFCYAGTSKRSVARPRSAWIPSDIHLAGLHSAMTVGSLPAVQIACVDETKVVWTHTFGLSNVQQKERASDDTLFEAASMSKPVFAYVVLKLAEDKLIDLNRPLAEYFRPDYFPPSSRIDRITAREVLTHSSGLPNWGGDTPESYLPSFEPGTAFRYSGEGYFWLQQVVEHLSGRGLESIMQTKLFIPLGLQWTSYTLTPRNVKRFSYGHEHGALTPQPRRVKLERLASIEIRGGIPLESWSQADFVKAFRETDAGGQRTARSLYVNAAASLLTTATEYAKLTTLLMEHRPRGSWEIRDDTRRAMISPQKRITNDGSYTWGLGWSVERTSTGVLFAHGGNNDNRFKTFAVGHAEQGSAVVVLTNGDSGDRIYERLIREATGHDLLAFLANLNPPALPPLRA